MCEKTMTQIYSEHINCVMKAQFLSRLNLNVRRQWSLLSMYDFSFHTDYVDGIWFYGPVDNRNTGVRA